MPIPFYSMDINARELKSIIKILFSGRFFDNSLIKEYENLISSTFSVKYVTTFPSGRTGFFFLLDALFKKGDEIIVSVYTFPLFVKFMHDKGIKPVFVDITQEDALINPELIEYKITNRTKGILVTHLFGNSCEMEKIVEICNKYNIYLIEDCAHAFDSKYKGQLLGTFGTASVFSTSSMKTPTTFGGGFVTTNDDDVYKKIYNSLHSSKDYVYSYNKFFKLLTFSLIYYLNSFPEIFSILTSKIFRWLKLKNPGTLRKIFYSELTSQKSFNPFERTKFTNFQAIIGISQIKRHEQMIEKRRNYAQIFDSYFKKRKFIMPIKEKSNRFNNFLYYIILVFNNTETFINKAMEKGLFLMREDVWNCNSYFFSKQYFQDCPVADKLQPLLVRLPNSSFLSENKIHKIAEVVCNAVVE